MGNKDTDSTPENERLQKACMEAEMTQKLTPIIKEELRCSILARRCKENKGDIVLDEKKPVIKTELTPEEIRKKLRRRQQNKDAARRCRAKKKRMENTVITDYYREQARAKQLEEEVTSLRNVLAQLQRLLDAHVSECKLTQAQSPPFYQQTNNFTFPAYSNDDQCSYTDDFLTDRQIQNATPALEDPFDETLQYAEAVMYPYSHGHVKHESTCTVTSSEDCLSNEMDTNLPSDLLDLDIPDSINQFIQPCSPDLFPGRQSISEFPEEDYIGVNN